MFEFIEQIWVGIVSFFTNLSGYVWYNKPESEVLLATWIHGLDDITLYYYVGGFVVVMAFIVTGAIFWDREASRFARRKARSQARSERTGEENPVSPTAPQVEHANVHENPDLILNDGSHTRQRSSLSPLSPVPPVFLTTATVSRTPSFPPPYSSIERSHSHEKATSSGALEAERSVVQATPPSPTTITSEDNEASSDIEEDRVKDDVTNRLGEDLPQLNISDSPTSSRSGIYQRMVASTSNLLQSAASTFLPSAIWTGPTAPEEEVKVDDTVSITSRQSEFTNANVCVNAAYEEDATNPEIESERICPETSLCHIQDNKVRDEGKMKEEEDLIIEDLDQENQDFPYELLGKYDGFTPVKSKQFSAGSFKKKVESFSVFTEEDTTSVDTSTTIPEIISEEKSSNEESIKLHTVGLSDLLLPMESRMEESEIWIPEETSGNMRTSRENNIQDNKNVSSSKKFQDYDSLMFDGFSEGNSVEQESPEDKGSVTETKNEEKETSENLSTILDDIIKEVVDSSPPADPSSDS